LPDEVEVDIVINVDVDDDDERDELFYVIDIVSINEYGL
jgi:hypothetical protein